MTSTLGSKGPISVLLYSDNSDVRAHVRSSIGNDVDGAAINWREVATFDALDELVKNERFSLIILDGEAHKVGGMGVARELKNSIFNCPPLLLLTGRAQDAWLASWSLADGAVARPLDSFELNDAVLALLSQELVVAED